MSGIACDIYESARLRLTVYRSKQAFYLAPDSTSTIVNIEYNELVYKYEMLYDVNGHLYLVSVSFYF